MVRRSKQQDRLRYGIGEWYGKLITSLTPEERDQRATAAKLAPTTANMLCPFRSDGGRQVVCQKRGGVCTLRYYRKDDATGDAIPVEGHAGNLVTVCPERFNENHVVYKWIGEKLLAHSVPWLIGQVNFLERVSTPIIESAAGVDSSNEQSLPGDADASYVGRIDCVLVNPEKSDPMVWCALEMQAVYFSGMAMSQEYDNLKDHIRPGLPFPSANRRPDWRSSGPKRLLPQLQVKVPTLRRWGKKMAVLVDEQFFSTLAPMEEVTDVSNSDIVWFVIGYDYEDGAARLVRRKTILTTLERAVEGLTAGVPVTQGMFERQIKFQLDKLSTDVLARTLLARSRVDADEVT